MCIYSYITLENHVHRTKWGRSSELLNLEESREVDMIFIGLTIPYVYIITIWHLYIVVASLLIGTIYVCDWPHRFLS